MTGATHALDSCTKPLDAAAPPFMYTWSRRQSFSFSKSTSSRPLVIYFRSQSYSFMWLAPFSTKNRDQLRNPMLGNRVWATVPLPFTQPVSWYSFHRPMEGGRLIDLGTAVKVHNPCDKHNRPRCDSNLCPVTPQSDALTTRLLRPMGHIDRLRRRCSVWHHCVAMCRLTPLMRRTRGAGRKGRSLQCAIALFLIWSVSLNGARCYGGSSTEAHFLKILTDFNCSCVRYSHSPTFLILSSFSLQNRHDN